jgi:Rrf2 family protein
VFKVSEAASLALHTAALLGNSPDTLMTTADIADELQVSENHLSKVLQRLTKAGIVKSTRGPKGGFVIGRPPADVTLLDVYEAIEGPFEVRKCLFARPICDGQCILGGLLKDVNTEIRQYLSATRLSAVPQLNGVTDA